MKKNNSSLEDEIDLGEIIKTLWNEKILILSISIVFMVIGYVYGALQPKIYKTEITIREAPSSLFEIYRPYLSTQQQQQKQQQQQQQQQGIAREFNDQVKLNLLSFDFLLQFFENNNKISDFKNNLKKKNISIEKYFQPQLGTRKFNSVIDMKNNIQNKYSLIYSEPLPGPSFLNEYIIFVSQQTISLYKQQLEQIIHNEIKIHQHHLEIANKIDLENPILQSMGGGVHIVNEQHALFYKGSKALTQQITYLNELLNKTKNLTLDYNPILEQALSGSLITKSAVIFLLLGLVLGLLFSFIIIFIKKTIKL